jgi:hypothetical protein
MLPGALKVGSRQVRKPRHVQASAR